MVRPHLGLAALYAGATVWRLAGDDGLMMCGRLAGGRVKMPLRHVHQGVSLIPAGPNPRPPVLTMPTKNFRANFSGNAKSAFPKGFHFGLPAGFLRKRPNVVNPLKPANDQMHC